jgi:predicted TIM-barrel fold metal-dependent hydrolase
MFAILPLLTILISCSGNYYTGSDFSKVAKIDAHIHLNSEKTYFPDLALRDNFRLISINVDHSDSAAVSDQLKFALQAVSKYPGNVFYSSTFFFDTTRWGTPGWRDNVISVLKNSIAGGAVSVKLWKNIGMTVRDRNGKFIMVDDPFLDPVIDFIISNDLPVTGHLGEPRNCWLPLDEMTIRGDSGYFANHPQYHMFLHPEYPSYEAQITARDNLLARNPDLKFIGCHLGSLEYDVYELAKRLDRFPNMAVDMSARICHLQYQAKTKRDVVRNFCIKYQDRLIYGTDVTDNGKSDPVRFSETMHETWMEDWKFLTSDDEMTVNDFKGSFRGIRLPKEVVNKIYSENAIKWYKLPEN